MELLPPYSYDKGYIHLPVKNSFTSLPETITFSGKEFHRKDSFHISLVCVKEIAPQIAIAKGISETDAEEKVLSLFAEYTIKHPISMGAWQKEFRLAKKEENETIVIRCSVLNLEGFFKMMNEILDMFIPVQPTHVTLYSLIPGKGIGITSDKAMEQCPKVHVKEIEDQF
jgi:hypothetical protein